MNIHDIIEIQGRMFQVKRKFEENVVNLEKGSTTVLKQYFHCDTIFRAQGYLWLCNEIKEVSYEEI